MGNDKVQALPVDTIVGCVVKGYHTIRQAVTKSGKDVTIIDFKSGVKVYLPTQSRDNALITCSEAQKDKTYVRMYNVSDAVIFGSYKTDEIRAVDCRNCVFNTSNDFDTPDYVYSFNTSNYDGKNHFLLGRNDQGYIEHENNGRRIIGEIDTKK